MISNVNALSRPLDLIGEFMNQSNGIDGERFSFDLHISFVDVRHLLIISRTIKSRFDLKE